MQKNDILAVFNLQKQYKNIVKNSSTKERKLKLKKLRTAIETNRTQILEALYNDFKKPEVEAVLSDIFPVLKEIDHCLAKLGGWMEPESVDTPLYMLGSVRIFCTRQKAIL
jgi:aldehyde dehydrogenase (NAD+)